MLSYLGVALVIFHLVLNIVFTKFFVEVEDWDDVIILEKNYVCFCQIPKHPKKPESAQKNSKIEMNCIVPAKAYLLLSLLLPRVQLMSVLAQSKGGGRLSSSSW